MLRRGGTRVSGSATARACVDARALAGTRARSGLLSHLVSRGGTEASNGDPFSAFSAASSAHAACKPASAVSSAVESAAAASSTGSSEPAEGVRSCRRRCEGEPLCGQRRERAEPAEHTPPAEQAGTGPPHEPPCRRSGRLQWPMATPPATAHPSRWPVCQCSARFCGAPPAAAPTGMPPPSRSALTQPWHEPASARGSVACFTQCTAPAALQRGSTPCHSFAKGSRMRRSSTAAKIRRTATSPVRSSCVRCCATTEAFSAFAASKAASACIAERREDEERPCGAARQGKACAGRTCRRVSLSGDCRACNMRTSSSMLAYMTWQGW